MGHSPGRASRSRNCPPESCTAPARPGPPPPRPAPTQASKARWQARERRRTASRPALPIPPEWPLPGRRRATDTRRVGTETGHLRSPAAAPEAAQRVAAIVRPALVEPQVLQAGMEVEWRRAGQGRKAAAAEAETAPRAPLGRCSGQERACGRGRQRAKPQTSVWPQPAQERRHGRR